MVLPLPRRAALLPLLLAASALAKSVTISNTAPRVDDEGNVLRAQDGCISRLPDGKYWLTAVRYQCCDVSGQPTCYVTCGWFNMTIAIYSSPDLEVWHLESESILPVATQPGNYSNTHTSYMEPCVMYSEAADHYVLWFLMIQPFCVVTPPCPQANTKAVAVASSPTGPFEVVTWDVGLPIGSDCACARARGQAHMRLHALARARARAAGASSVVAPHAAAQSTFGKTRRTLSARFTASTMGRRQRMRRAQATTSRS